MDEQKFNPLSGKKRWVEMPNKPVVITVAVAVIAAVLLTLLGNAEIFPFDILAIFGWVVSMFAHEIGHAAAGWLFGVPSFPMPMLTFHMEKSFIAQILVLAGLGFFAYRAREKNKTELFYTLIILMAFSVAVSFVGHHDHVASYMGHGGSIAIGSMFLYYAITRGEKYETPRCFLYAFVGMLMIFENVIFSADLIANMDALSEYKKDMPLIGHNDFEKIARDTSFSVKSLALLTILNGIIGFAVALWLALVPHESSEGSNLS